MALSKTISPLRVIFAGTPDFAATHLNALFTSPHSVVGVFTQPDRPAGRGKRVTASPVKKLAKRRGVPIFQPKTLKTSDVLQHIADLNADVMVVVAYGLLLPKAVLSLPRFGCINVHGSLLPKWRGAAPIQRACLAGDSETGITIMQMDVGLDTGDILHRVSCPITEHDTSASLYKTLAQLGSDALLTTLNDLSVGATTPIPQRDQDATYAEKLSKQEAQLDWNKSAYELNRAIRAFNPWPGSYFYRDGHLIKVWESHVLANTHSVAPGTLVSADKHGIAVATSDGILVMTLLQPAGKTVVTAEQLLNSKRDWFHVGSVMEGRIS